jgi:hexulose-6-phosphate isomerase
MTFKVFIKDSCGPKPKGSNSELYNEFIRFYNIKCKKLNFGDKIDGSNLSQILGYCATDILTNVENNIKINSVTCDFFMQKPFYKLKKKKDKIKNLEILKKVIKNGQKIGIQLFILPLVDNSSIESFNQEKELVSSLNEKNFLKLLKKKSQILFESDYSPKKIIKFIKKFNLKKFGINYDTGNSASLNYKVRKEKIYFKYVKNIHIKDRLKNGPSVRLGNGNWDYISFFNILKKIKYNNNLILQTARAKNGNHVEEINISKKFVLNLL